MEEEMLQHIKDFLIKRFNPSFIILFGSYAKNSIHENSDIDIAFYAPHSSLTTYELFLTAQELADILMKEVDLINLETASTVFQAQIYSTGTVLYSKDDNLLSKLQMTALSMYAKLNEERKDILENIKESGTIYGK